MYREIDQDRERLREFLPWVDHMKSVDNQIWLRDMKTGDDRQLTPPGANDVEPSFSPDGHWLAVSRARGDESLHVETPPIGRLSTRNNCEFVNASRDHGCAGAAVVAVDVAGAALCAAVVAVVVADAGVGVAVSPPAAGAAACSGSGAGNGS